MISRKVKCLGDFCCGVRYGYRGCTVLRDERGADKENAGAERILLVSFSLVIQVATTLEEPTAAEVLLRKAGDILKMPLYWKRCVREVHVEVAHPNVRDYVDRAKAVMLSVEDIVQSIGAFG